MLKITQSFSAGKSVLHLAGSLTGRWVDELKKACEAARAEQRNVVLDFTDVVFVDRAGATLIRKLMDVGLLLSNCSPFVSEQLKQPLSEKGAANSE